MPVIEVLVVCTANQCRSPLIAALLSDRLADRGVTVTSAGLYSGGAPATELISTAAAELGLDLSRHRSRMLDVAEVSAADLVLGVSRAHVREAVVLDPGARGKTFTLPELVRRGMAAGPRPPDEPLARWLGRLSASRLPADLLGESAQDDVADPTGLGLQAHRHAVTDLVALVDSAVALAWP